MFIQDSLFNSNDLFSVVSRGFLIPVYSLRCPNSRTKKGAYSAPIPSDPQLFLKSLLKPISPKSIGCDTDVMNDSPTFFVKHQQRNLCHQQCLAISTTEGLMLGSDPRPFDLKFNTFNHSATDPKFYFQYGFMSRYNLYVQAINKLKI